MIESKDLELKTALTVGTLTTNAANIKAFVDEQLKNYTPDLYIGRADEAKKDRAELNKAADALNKKRQEIEREFNKPFEDFKSIITSAVKSIKDASAQLDTIVKGEEQREKNEKQKEIEKIWAAHNFNMVPLSRVFNQKWLNKTTKISAIQKEIDTIIGGILEDLNTIDSFDAADVPLIKTLYLDTLSLSEAAAYAKTLKENREKLAQEQKARQAHAIDVQIKEQKANEKQERIDNVVADAVEQLEFKDGRLIEPIEQIKPEPLESYALIFTGTRQQLTCMREYMTRAGISYSKLADNGDGTFTL